MRRRNPFIYDAQVMFRKIDELSPEERELEAEDLRDALTYHMYLKKVLNEPAVSDAVLDLYRSRLCELERRYAVGEAASGFDLSLCP
jgi:hypothetical protein